MAVGSSCAVHGALMATFQLLFRRRRGGWALCCGELLRSQRRCTNAARPQLVSILKPLAGYDDDLDANLDSFAALSGARYEILFGVASRGDPASRAAEAFIARHPHIDARLVVTDPDAAINPKVAQLAGLAAEARGDVIVTSDSNVRVRPDYLVHLLAPLADPRCGLVTSIFAGTGEQTLGAALENLHLAAVIAPCVVLSTLGIPVTVGKSMAMRRADLVRLGGFRAFGKFLAEDAMMGRAVAKAGMRVATSFVPVENRNVAGPVSRTFHRHTRWAKMRRALSPAFFAAEPVFSPVLVATIALVAVRDRSIVALLVASILLQTVTAGAAAWTIRGNPLPWRYLAVEVVRVFVIAACWASAWSSRTVVWRGNPLLIGRGTVVRPVTARADETAVTIT